MAERNLESLFISAVMREKSVSKYKGINGQLITELHDGWQLLLHGKTKQAKDLLGELPEAEFDSGQYLEELITNYNNVKLIEATTFVNDQIGAVPPEVLSEHLKQVTLITLDHKWISIDEVEEETMQRLDTGFAEMEQFNICQRQLILLAAEKKIGKTRFVIALSAAMSELNELPVLAFTWEMSAGDYKHCFKLTQRDTRKIYVIKDPMTVFEVGRNIREFCSEYGPAIVIVDNIGLIQRHERDDNKQDADVARVLKESRDETTSIIFAIHHLVKHAGARGSFDADYEPRLEDIRGSGRLQDYSNQVWMLHRPSHYNDLMNHFRKTVEDPKALRLLEKLMLVLVRLNRSGPTGDARLGVNLAKNKFWQMTSVDYDKA